MAFDISQLFGQSAVNKLLNPSIDAPQNFLTHPEAALAVRAQQPMPQPAPQMQAPQNQQTAQVPQRPDPWAGLRDVSVDPMQTGSVRPQQNAQYVDSRSTRDKLHDMFNGWASGANIGDSLARGADAYRGQNQTIKYLMNNGYSQEDAQAINGNRDALNMAFTNIFRKGDPLTAMQLQKAGLDIQKSQRDLDRPQLLNVGNGNLYNADTGGFISAPANDAKETPDIQNYKFAKEDGYKGGFSDFITERARAVRSSNKPVLSVDGSDVDLNGLPAVEVDENGVPNPDHQKAFLSKLPPATAAQVKGIVDGRVDLTKSTSMKDGQRQAYSQLASMFDPNFDMSMGPLRAQTRKNYGPGGYMGKMADSTNLAIQHLNAMKQAYDKIGNGNWNSINSARNWWNGEGGNGPLAAFRAAQNGVAGELEKTFTGSNGTEGGRSDWKDSFNENASPQQMHDAIETAMHMLSSRVETYNNGWDHAMRSKNQFPLLTPNSIKALKGMGFDTNTLQGLPAAAAPSTPKQNSDGSVSINGYNVRKL